jgi:hypothetical protein
LGIVSGLDWSGDGGDPRKTPGSSPLFVTVVVHIVETDWHLLETVFEDVRRQRSLPSNYSFHFSGSRPQIRDAFFRSLRTVPIHVHARIADKRQWMPAYMLQTSGEARIQAEIVQLLIQCPDHCISGQTLLIDGSRRDAKKSASIKTDLNRRLSSLGKSGIGKIKLCQDDHPTRGAIIQAADMFAGALRDAGNVNSPYLNGFGSRITLV